MEEVEVGNSNYYDEDDILSRLPPNLDETDLKLRKAIAIIPKFVGLFSLLGSCYIVHSLAGTASARRSNLGEKPGRNTFNRFLLGLSIGDIVASLAFFMSTWMIPKYDSSDETLVIIFRGSEQLYYDYFPYASGNRWTCAMQGFFVQFGLFLSVAFTGCISLQYVFTVRLQWREAQMKFVERICIFSTIVLGLVFAIVPTVTGTMNASTAGFWYVYCSC